MRVSVVGGSSIDSAAERTAESLGRELAQRGHTVVCGGLGGTMEAVCRGARTADGETIGVLPSDRLSDANSHVTIPIATGIGHARNALVVMNGDAVIALAGGAGTLSEIGLAAVYDRPIAGIGTHDVAWIVDVETPEAAVRTVEDAYGNRSRNY